MLDFIGSFASILITLVIVFGFLALGALFVFELAAMAVFWLKHAYRGQKTPAPVSKRRPLDRFSFGQDPAHNS